VTQANPLTREQVERNARMLRNIMAAQTPVLMALLVYELGFGRHRDGIGIACIFAGVYGVLSICMTWWLYRSMMKRARAL
jgi:ABC-type sugar transport system permease subunit